MVVTSMTSLSATMTSLLSVLLMHFVFSISRRSFRIWSTLEARYRRVLKLISQFCLLFLQSKQSDNYAIRVKSIKKTVSLPSNISYRSYKINHRTRASSLSERRVPMRNIQKYHPYRMFIEIEPMRFQ